MSSALDYFDLNKKPAGSLKAQITEKDKMSVLDQIVMYIGVLIGIVLSPTINNYAEGKPILFSLNVPLLLVSAAIALIIIPYVYKKIDVDPSAPFIVKLGLFVQNGVFWQLIFSSIGKAI
jgi:hypothetical protein